MEKTRKETGLKRLMSNYIKLLFCAVVSVALFYGCDNNDDNIIPGKPPKKLENAYISNYVIVDQLRYFYMSDTYDSIPTDPHIQFWLVGRSCSDDELENCQESTATLPITAIKLEAILLDLLSATQ